ncbi:DnaJ protein ERDJ3B (Chaperone protein dnaJ 19) (AtDjB19) (AtJ19) (Endoplasmic reticulum dnaJ domain-containing protein 3B) (AtERdj3B) (Protein SCJ1 homolog ERDJ3B) [Durusdinium trenchii]|uniref:DnaJ protein ERDJ3B (Chaperone protein dnaJ 19) (AtDjB19) (AtJ19) (Endoplasmic reticulum dnaJ domain-containing protein 3B) (AtERdj3B) (Protein SCJ1 homolog ERDJ3B) n=2 Tax=Durusdinium trenchii TaxID=1381693 RepID=A0ABP0JAK4_9DINO
MQSCLEAAGLSQYKEAFLREGFDDVAALLKRAQRDGNTLTKELSEDLRMPKGHARKLVWHLQELGVTMTTSTNKPEPEHEAVKNEVKEEPTDAVQSSPEQTHYDILQVDGGASFREIRQSYLKLVVRTHPDKPGGTTAGFQRLEVAYDTLSDAERRREYDNKIGLQGVTAHPRCQRNMEDQYDIQALWSAMLAGGRGCWVQWLAALPRGALAGLQELAEGQCSSSRACPELTQALVAIGSIHDGREVQQLDSELDCGRDILTSLVSTLAAPAPTHCLVEELVQAIRPAATRALSNQAADAQVVSNTLRQLLRRLVYRTKWAKRYRDLLQNFMPEVTQAYMASAGTSFEMVKAMIPPVPATAGSGTGTSKPQEPTKKQNGHYYRAGKGWMTKVVVKSVHMMSQSSKNLTAVAEARASLTTVKRLTEASVRAGVDFAQALQDATQVARPQCLTPLIWQCSYDARELVPQAGMTPSTPLLEEMLQQREELQLRVKGPLGCSLTGEDLKGLCNDMRKKRKEAAEIDSEERLLRARAGLGKLVKQELDCRNAVKMLGLNEEILLEEQEQKQTIPARRRSADRLAARFLQESEEVTDAQVLAVLSEWGFEENSSRQNVMPRGRTFIYSDILGAVRTRMGAVQLTQPTALYPNVSRLLCKNFQQSSGMAIPHTSMCINKGYPSKKHRDSHNEGPSAIKGFGSYDGGELLYWPRDSGQSLASLAESDASVLDIRTPTAFDGCRAHATKAFQGTRFSVVLYTVKNFETLQGHQRILLSEAGYNVSSPASMARFKAVLSVSDFSAFHLPSMGQTRSALPEKRSSAESACPEAKRARTALPDGVMPLSGRAKAWNLPEGWACGFKMTSTNRKVKVAVGPCGQVFWDLRQAKRAYPGVL